MALSSGPVTETWNTEGNFDWKDKDPALSGIDFPTTGVSQEYGQTIGWQFKEGRDFQSGFASDSRCFFGDQ